MISGRLWTLLGVAGLFAVALIAFSIFPPKPLPEKIVTAPFVYVERISVENALIGWKDDDQAEALRAFRLSCTRLLTLPDDRPMGDETFGTVADWRPACTAALADGSEDADAARAFFQTWFRPVAIRNNGDDIGLFTGYFEPELNGHTVKKAGPVPGAALRAAARLRAGETLVEFRDDLKGQRIVGRVVNGRLEAERRPAPRSTAGRLEGRDRGGAVGRRCGRCVLSAHPGLGRGQDGGRCRGCGSGMPERTDTAITRLGGAWSPTGRWPKKTCRCNRSVNGSTTIPTRPTR